MGNRNPSKRINGQIAIAALGLALGIIFLSLSFLIPGTELLIMVIIPFLSAVVAIKSDYRGQLLYLAGIICVSFIDLQEGFFELLPNAIIGLAFGIMVKYFSISFLTYLVSLSITLFIEIGLIYPINWIFNVDMIGIYATVLKLPRGFFSDIFPLFYFLVSIVQTLISFIIISNELPKLNLKQKERKINNIIMYSSLDIVFIILFVIGYFLYLKLCYLALGYMCLCAGVQTTDSFRSNKGVIIIYCIAETIGVFAFVGLLSKLDGKIAFICFIPFLLINMVVSIILSIYFKYNKKIYKPLENDTDSKKRLM